jgi:hypothetical protein
MIYKHSYNKVIVDIIVPSDSQIFHIKVCTNKVLHKLISNIRVTFVCYSEVLKCQLLMLILINAKHHNFIITKVNGCVNIHEFGHFTQ